MSSGFLFNPILFAPFTWNPCLDHLHSEPSRSCHRAALRGGDSVLGKHPQARKSSCFFFSLKNHTLTLIAASNALFKDSSWKTGSSLRTASKVNQKAQETSSLCFAPTTVSQTFGYNGHFNTGTREMGCILSLFSFSFVPQCFRKTNAWLVIALNSMVSRAGQKQRSKNRL